MQIYIKRTRNTGEALTYWTMDTIWNSLLTDYDYKQRKKVVLIIIKIINLKRKDCYNSIKYPIGWGGANHSILLNIFTDGTVQITSSGIEIGQGVNTKVVQVASKI